MRLTGLSDIAARAVRATGTNAAGRVESTSQPTALRDDHVAGAAAIVGGRDRSPSFDAERVAEIRKAIKEDRYPLIPTQIADALIAAKLYGIVEG